MPQEQDECERRLERWVSPLVDAGFRLAVLAVIRRGEADAREAAQNIFDYTAGMMKADETKLARELETLVEKAMLRSTAAAIGSLHWASGTCS